MSDKFNNVLIHHGVKGMKWGVRRSKEALSRGSKKFAPSKKDRNAQSRRKDAVSRRRTLSDRDLDDLIKRIEKERRLKTLVNEDLRPGRTFVKKTLVSSGGKVAAAVATGAGVAAISAIVGRNWSNPKVDSVVKLVGSSIPKIKK